MKSLTKRLIARIGQPVRPTLVAAALLPAAALNAGPEAWSSSPPSAEMLECDVPYTAAVEAGQTQELSFDLNEGEIVSFVVARIDPSEPGFDPEWRVVQSGGEPAASCGLWRADRAGDCGPFPASGSPYRIQMRDSDQDASGTVKVNFQRLTAAYACESEPLACGGWLWSPIDDPTDCDLIELNFSDQAEISVSVYNWDPPGPDFAPEWRLLQGDGHPAVSGGTWTATSTRTCGPLPGADGPYRIEVRDFEQDSFGICRVVLDECRGVSEIPPKQTAARAFGLRLDSDNPICSTGAGRVGFVIDVPVTSRVSLDLVDAAGRLVARVLDRTLDSGEHVENWDARGLPDGLYLCRLRSAGRLAVTKLIVVH